MAYQALMNNSAYIQAESDRRAGDFVQADAGYAEALAEASSPAQAARIRSRQAQLKILEGDVLAAIVLYKQAAAETGAEPHIRAGAVASMGQLYGWSFHDPAVTAEIFKDAPYTAMRVEGDEAVSYRHLYEYASLIYPMPLANVLIADWYARQLLVSTSSPEAVSYKTAVQRRLAAADTGLSARMARPLWYQDGPSLVPDTLAHKAIVIGLMVRAGLLPASAREEAYQKAIDAYLMYGSPPAADSLARLTYAGFLALTYGKARTSDISVALAPLSTPTYARSQAVRFLKKLPASLTVGYPEQKGYMQALAGIDPDFKQLLVSLGWTADDLSYRAG